ncbi:MAG: Wzz/FepE/Etk N-terminal domain-containing protein [Terracidiphilus sp.]|jgi:polysaccharide chain length determinant protein (PEP-CTERM system associated)
MVEALEEQELERPDIRRLFGIVRRRHLQFLIPLFLGWIVVWGITWVLPPRYKSSTLILVEQPTMPQNYVAPNINDDLQARLQSMTEQILSRTRLLLIIQKLRLYDGAQKKLTDDQKIANMRKDIGVQLVRDPQRQDISSFTISYSASDPHLARQVTAELTGLFISENLKVRQEESEGTTDFLQQQLQGARETLSEQEAKVREFEGQHEGALPTQEASNLQILAGLQSQLQSEQDALNTAKQQRVYLQALLEQERTVQSRVRPAGAEGTSATAPTDLASVDAQLDKLKTQLADLSSRYTDQYPDVQNVRKQIVKLEVIRDNLIAATKAKSNEAKQPADNSGAADPTLTGPAMQTQSQLQANQMEIGNRESAIANLKARINDYQGRLNAEPATEQQLADLSRGYDQSKANYDDLLKKEDESAMATSMEQMQEGERFTMLDPPSLPSKPDFPNRLKFCSIGLAVGLALGLIVAGGFEFMDDRLHTEKEIKSLLPIAVISEIPEIVSPLDERNSKKKLALGWVATVLVVGTILAGSVFSFLHN